MKKILLLSAIAGISASLAAAPAMAGTSSGIVTVGATTTAVCTAPGATTVSLGSYDGTTAIVNATNNITFKCTNTTPATVTFASASTNSAGSGNLTNPTTSTPIIYTFTGDGTIVTGAGVSGAAASLTVAAPISVAADQDPAPGSYSDTIAVTVTY